MRKLVTSAIVSLDGIVARPHEWSSDHFDGEVKDYSRGQLTEYDAFLLGRVTYEGFVATWPHIQGEEYFDTINAMPKYVASDTLTEVSWNATILRGDVADQLARLKRQPGKNIVKYGTGLLDRMLFARNLTDELHLLQLPVVVGGGQRLLEGVDTSGYRFELARTTTFRNGAVALTYLPRRR